MNLKMFVLIGSDKRFFIFKNGCLWLTIILKEFTEVRKTKEIEFSHNKEHLK